VIGAIEASILARLTDRLTGWRIAAMADADLARRQGGSAQPALYLAFGGIETLDAAGRGAAQRVDVAFVAVLVARHAQGAARGASAARGALALVDDVFSALAGFQPDGATGPLRLTGAGPAEYEPPTFWLPVEFSCSTVLKGAP
jgi:phage gp37-like protein